MASLTVSDLYYELERHMRTQYNRPVYVSVGVPGEIEHVLYPVTGLAVGLDDSVVFYTDEFKAQ